MTQYHCLKLHDVVTLVRGAADGGDGGVGHHVSALRVLYTVVEGVLRCAALPGLARRPSSHPPRHHLPCKPFF